MPVYTLDSLKSGMVNTAVANGVSEADIMAKFNELVALRHPALSYHWEACAIDALAFFGITVTAAQLYAASSYQ